MEFTGYVQDYQLRDLLRIGQKATIVAGSIVTIHYLQTPRSDQPIVETLTAEKQVTVRNFLPGHVDIYADSMGRRKTHNHQVVWQEGDLYYSTDINNVKEIQNA